MIWRKKFSPKASSSSSSYELCVQIIRSDISLSLSLSGFLHSWLTYTSISYCSFVEADIRIVVLVFVHRNISPFLYSVLFFLKRLLCVLSSSGLFSSSSSTFGAWTFLEKRICFLLFSFEWQCVVVALLFSLLVWSGNFFFCCSVCFIIIIFFFTFIYLFNTA